MKSRPALCACICAPLCLSGNVFEDLARVEAIDRDIQTTVPLTFNYNLSGGYFTMPSARTAPVGTLGIGASFVPPYRNYNVIAQLYDRLEVTANYHIMVGITDSILGESFGDWSDRSMNYKLVFLKPEDSNYMFPGIALGSDDFFGSKNFFSQYAVATQVIPDVGAELSLGVGRGRIKGFFGGLSLSPFYRSNYFFLKGLTLSAEYDGIDYANDPTSVLGREVKSRINAGLHYNLGNVVRLSFSSIRGVKFSGGLSATYNFGEMPAAFGKFLDPKPYSSPKDYEPIGVVRPYQTLSTQLTLAFKEQALPVYQITSFRTKRGGKGLSIFLANSNYPNERDYKERIAYVLANLLPENIERVRITVQEDAIAAHQMTFQAHELRKWRDKEISTQTLITTAPDQNITSMGGNERTIYKRDLSPIHFTVRPRANLFFGSAAGKLKYDLAVVGGALGYLFNQIYYEFAASANVIQGFGDVHDVDKLNPSQLINVRSDTVTYYKDKVGALDRAFIQKSWSIGDGWFGRLAGGYFEVAYGGIASELLYKEAGARWAIGVEGALVAKRKYSGLTFTRRIRQLRGFTPTYKTNYIGSQYFLSLYYDVPQPIGLQGQLRVGQFLARDVGARLDIQRVFKNGTSLGYWVSWTNARDIVNGERFFDQGISFKIPLDLYSPRSTRRSLKTASSFWLRDTGALSATGKRLAPVLFEK